MIKSKQNTKPVTTVKEPVKITDITAPNAFAHIKQGGMAVDAMRTGLINAYELALYNTPAGLAYHIVNIFEQEGLDVFIGTQQIDTLLEQGILEGVAALNKLRKQTPEFLTQVAKSREHLQERDTAHVIRLCAEVLNFSNRGVYTPDFVPNHHGQMKVPFSIHAPEPTTHGGFNDVFWSDALGEIYGSNLLAKVRHMKDPEKWPGPLESVKKPFEVVSTAATNDNPMVRLSPLEDAQRDNRNPTPEELVYGKTAGELIEKMAKSRETSLLLTLFADELYARCYTGDNEEQQLLIDISRFGSDSFAHMLELARSHDRNGSLWESRLENMKVDELTELMKCHYRALGYFLGSSETWRDKTPSQDYWSVFKSKLTLEAFPTSAISTWHAMTNPPRLWD